jgi:hypothetical protein
LKKRRYRLYLYLAGFVALGLALSYGRTRTAPELTVPIGEIFPDATSFVESGDVFQVHDQGGRLLGWAGTGDESGYGGPMLVVAGIDTLGRVAGVRIVQQRETPIFWRMVRAGEYLAAITGSRYDAIDYDYRDVVGVTGATISSDAVVGSIRASVAKVAGEAFDDPIPLPRRPFEFGILEISVLVLLVVGFTVHRAGGILRRRLRWACQIAGLIVIGFWQDSPITLAKITAMLSGFLPDIRTGLALYLLLAGFAVTSFAWGRNIYCLYACPFGAAQRCVGVIGGKRFKLPVWSGRALVRLRNLIVFAALFMAFLTLQPALASYEPFAALFSLRGSTLQWLLLFIVLVVSLFIRTPWCSFFCPMRTFEIAIKDLRALFRKKGLVTADE